MTEENKIEKEKTSKQEQKKGKSIFKKLLKAVFIILLSLVGLNVLLYVLLSIPWVQQRVVDFAIDQLKPIVKTEIKIDEVRITLLNEINLKGVYIEDLQKDTLLYAGNLNAQFNLWQFIKNNTLLINSVSLDKAVVKVSAETLSSPYNFQFLIDAFAGDSTQTDTTSSTLKIDISKVDINNTRLSYNIWSEADTISGFNASHIHISDLNASLALPSLDMKAFEGHIYNLSFKEKSGLTVKNMIANIHSKGDEFHIDKLILAFPQSELNIVSAKYNMANNEFALVSQETKLMPADFTPFLPNLKFLTHPLELKTSIAGKLPQVAIDSLVLNYGENTKLRANASISDYSKYDTAQINLEIAKLNISNKDIKSFAQVGDSTIVLPDMLNLLGDIRFKGSLNGKLDDIKIDAEAVTRQGGLTLKGKGSTDTTFQNFVADAVLHTQNFNLRPFVGDSLGIGRLSLDISVNAKQSKKQPIMVQAKGILKSLQFKDDWFRNVPFTAYYSEAKMGAWLDAKLPIGDIKGDVEIIQSKEPKYIFDLDVRNFCIGEFYMAENWHDPWVSFSLNGNLQGKDINTLLGDVTLDSLVFSDAGFHFDPGTITLQAGANNTGRYIALRSSICDANLSGKYNFLTLYDEVSEMMHPYLPDIFELPTKKRKLSGLKTNNFAIDAFIDNTESLAKIIELPLVLYEPLQIHVGVNSPAQEIDISGYAPDFQINDISFKETNLELNCDSSFNIKASTRYVQGTAGYIGINLSTSAKTDTLNTLIKVKNSGQDIDIEGEINALASFKRSANNELVSNVEFLPTNIKVGNLQFSMLPANVKYEEAKVYIENFGFALKDKHFLIVDGIASDKRDDRLNVFFDKAQVGSILEAFEVKNVNATINGDLIIDAALGDMELFTQDFSVADIYIFGDTLGTLDVNSKWLSAENAVNLNLALNNSKKGTRTTLTGLVHTQTSELDLVAKIDRFSLDWAQPFVADMLNKLSGSLSAGISIKGTADAPQLDGWLGLNDATFGIDYTNVTYHITDTIKIAPDRIGFDYLILSDDFGNYGLASATLTHKNFEDMQYTLDMHLYNLMVLNTESRTDSLFYGKVQASGDVKIVGNDNDIKINMNIANSRNSNINILLPQTSSASEYKSIVYINTPETEDSNKKEKVVSSLPLKLDVDLTIDPRMNFRVVINPLTGDEMHVTGNGNVKFTYDLQSDRMTTFGEYIITEGAVRYKQVKTFDFQIQEGSKLTFSGDPLRTSFDITAFRRVRGADLKTLDASFASEALPSTRMDVDCILKISGNLDRMDLSYDVSFPEATDDVRRKLQSLINTDEQRVKQFASLVALGTFYSSGTANIGDGMATSILAGTLSSSLNSIFSSVLGNEWEVGTNIASNNASFSDMDVSVNVSRKFLNNKLKLSTNLGYRTAQTTDNPFIGDFDVEYELTNNWKLKAYNHSNEQYYRQALTIQGVGISYTKEAKTIRDLFRFFSRKQKNKDGRKKE